MAEYTFFHNPMSRGQMARWALHEVGADYETVLVDWKDKPEALLAANPMGKVPTIVHHAEDGDRVVCETAAVLHYLAEMHPQAGLLPTAAEKAPYFRWMFFAAGPVEAAVTIKALGMAVPPEREGFVGWGTYDRVVAALDAHFAANDFVCGARFTMADVYVGSHVDWGLAFKSLPTTPAFEAYAERCRAREAYKAGKAIDNGLIAEMQS